MTGAATSLEVVAEVFREGRVVDPTLPLAEDLPCTRPGHMPYQHKTFSWFAARHG